MVRKAQLKFMIFTALALLVFFACIYGLTCSLMKNGTNHEILNKLDEIESLRKNEGHTYPYDHFIAMFDGYDEQNQVKITIKVNEGFSVEDIEAISKLAIEKNTPMGSVDNNYYKMVYLNNSPHHVVGADVTHILEIYNKNVVQALWVMLLIYTLILIFNWLFSFWVFKPIKETISKQKQFISDVSHELKTPVAIISANADVIKTTAPSKYLDSIKSQSNRIGVLVNDLLTLSSIDEGIINQKRGPFSATEAVLQTALPFDAVAFEKKKFLVLNVENDVIVNGLREDLVKICGILLDNAVKYSLANSEIVVTLKKESSKTIFSVFNQGCFVTKENSQRIFDRFYRVDSSRSRDLGGSGLGLPIAKSLADRNHWKITAHPVYNQSMQVTITF